MKNLTHLDKNIALKSSLITVVILLLSFVLAINLF